MKLHFKLGYLEFVKMSTVNIPENTFQLYFKHQNMTKTLIVKLKKDLFTFSTKVGFAALKCREFF